MSHDPRSSKIASELAYFLLTNPNEATEFAFEFDGQKAIVRLEAFRNPAGAPDRLYVSLGPPGDKCKCCDGTGLQDRIADPPMAAI